MYVDKKNIEAIKYELLQNCLMDQNQLLSNEKVFKGKKQLT